MPQPVAVTSPGEVGFGALLRHWRAARRLSQLDLGLEARVSPRHVSFLETGRAAASAEMVLRLADALDVPFRERNLLLLAAGHAPVYRESSLDAPEMRDTRRALELILRGHEPFAAWALDAGWHLLMLNRPAAASFSLWLDQQLPSFELLSAPRPNLLEMVATVGRSLILNWDVVLCASITRAYRDALWSQNRDLRSRVLRLAEQAGVKYGNREPDLSSRQSLVIPIETHGNGCVLRFFNTITTLGAPQDITLQELRIEAMHPADDGTEARVRAAFAEDLGAPTVDREECLRDALASGNLGRSWLRLLARDSVLVALAAVPSSLTRPRWRYTRSSNRDGSPPDCSL